MTPEMLLSLASLLISLIGGIFLFMLKSNNAEKNRRIEMVEARILVVEGEVKEHSVVSASLKQQIDSLVNLINRIEKTLDKIELKLDAQ